MELKAEFWPYLAMWLPQPLTKYTQKSNRFIGLLMFTLSPNLKKILSYILKILC